MAKTTLEDLMEQKREIERQIRELSSQAVICGNVKIDVEHYPTDKPDRHYLAVEYALPDSKMKRWRSIFSAGSRDEVIAAIPGLIAHLEILQHEGLKSVK